MKYAIETLEIELNRLISINRSNEVKAEADELTKELCKKNQERIDQIRNAISLIAKSQSVTIEGVTNNNIRMIAEKVCFHLKLDPQKLFIKTRKREVVQARQYVYWLALNEYGIKPAWVSRYFGHDHTTGLYSINTIKDLLDSDAETKKWISFFHNECAGGKVVINGN